MISFLTIIIRKFDDNERKKILDVCIQLLKGLIRGLKTLSNL